MNSRSHEAADIKQASGSTPTEAAAREFAFSDADFCAIRDLVKEMTGISLADSKRELVYGRISRRIRALGLTGFGDYRRLLRTEDAVELVEFCNALTTNLTSFFRESHHFDYLKSEFLLPRMADARASRRVRIWSAACSSGEEPYSIAMTVCETIRDWQGWDIKILATDLDSNMVTTARKGVYTEDRVKQMDPTRLSRFFRDTHSAKGRAYEVVPELKKLVVFKPINLMHDLPMPGPLDAIFCRNVVIYFEKETQKQLFARMARLQREGDLMFLGHSENLFKVSTDYELIGKTIYRRSVS